MNVENLLRETLADMAGEQEPPPPARFLPLLSARRPARRPNRRPARRRGAALAAAVTVVALAVGGTITVRALSPEPEPGGWPQAPAVPATRPQPERTYEITVGPGRRVTGLFGDLARMTGKPAESFARAAEDGRALGLPPYAKGRLEGFAHPGTYSVAGSATPAEILAGMVARFRETADRIGLAAAPDPLDVVIIASLIQAESPTEADMPKVSRVIHNRLARGMMLQLDSTVLYGLGKHSVAATAEDVRSRSPYNTYRHRGLPPGPIANPGPAALKAALHPAAGRWLSFVVTDPERGTLAFASNEKEYNELVERARRSE
ncbi:endolytic transglycosylase MltG [[Actinomadura] parvosata]|uniref:endolytic transglycosylase MltG n=1 Tax=[Actinomadura] parvosata TaxID=1955412 RepID=UPI00406CDC68